MGAGHLSAVRSQETELRKESSETRKEKKTILRCINDVTTVGHRGLSPLRFFENDI